MSYEVNLLIYGSLSPFHPSPPKKKMVTVKYVINLHLFTISPDKN